MLEKLRKFGPEFYTYRIYTKLFTPIRVVIFWLLVAFCFGDIFWLNLDFTRWLPFWNQGLFDSIIIKMIYLLLSVGAFTATFFTILIEIVKTKKNLTAPNIKYLWSKLFKYTSYPFVVAVLIGTVIFFRDAGLYQNIPFPIFLLFVFLTINSFYTTTKMAEILVTESWSQEQNFSIKIKAPKEKVWQTLWEDKTFRDWGNIIDEGLYMVGEMKEGNEVQFISSVSGVGVTSVIEKLAPHEYITFRQIADTMKSGEQERKKEWTGGTKSYSLTEKDGVTSLTVEIDVPPGQEETFKVRFPRALKRVKVLAEKK